MIIIIMIMKMWKSNEKWIINNNNEIMKKIM